MSHNQTIDGVSRKSLEQALKLAAVFDDGGDGADAESARGVVWILRALLDAPAVLGEIDLTPKRLAHAEIVIEQQNNLIASLRAELVESYRVAAQPQGEPVGWQIRSRTNRPESVWTGWRECSEMERAMHSHEVGKFNPFGIMREIRPLYAEQPAPVAVAPERPDMTDGLNFYEHVTGHNAAIDKMRVAKP